MESRFQIPDFLVHCPFNARVSEHYHQSSTDSERWLYHSQHFTDKDRHVFLGLKAGLLASMCYPTVDSRKLRVCCDFINLLFYIKSLADFADVESVAELADVVLNALYYPHQSPVAAGQLSRTVSHLWNRLQQTCPVHLQLRLIESMESFFVGLQHNALDHAIGAVPNVEDYILRRRETSICQPAFLLIEYAHGLDLPSQVYDDPIILNLTCLANDLISWSNDILSYNVDQSQSNVHNIVTLVMHENHLEVQDAVNYISSIHYSTLDLFVDHFEADMPSWGVKRDSSVATYLRGLQDCIVASLHWSFETERYFGSNGYHVRERGLVTLTPRVWR